MGERAVSIISSIVLFAITWLVSWMLPQIHQVIELFAIVLVIIGSVYLGFAFKDEDPQHQIIEISAASGFILMAAFGLWWNPWLIVIGLIAHGLWDLVHHNTHRLTKIPSWYIPLCLIYDILAGGYFAFYLMTNAVQY